MKGVAILIVVLAMVQLMVEPSYALTCGQVDAALTSCVPYLTKGGVPTTECCAGVRKIKDLSANIADKKTACNCVKNAANRYSDLDDAAAKALPDKCGVQLDIPVSRTTNCDAVSVTLTCGQVDAALTSCVPYLTKGGVPSTDCCAGVRKIKDLSANIADKKTACNCVKNAANRYSDLDDAAAKALPDKCGVQLDIPVSRTTNCDAVSVTLTCGQVDAALTSCVPYLTKGGVPSTDCCAGVRKIKDLSANIADKKTACNCVKNAANRYSNLDDAAAKALPDKCGVQLDIPVSRTTNCDAVSVTLTCGQVDAALTSCVPYLTKGGVPSTDCCAGVRKIKEISANIADKKTACNCVKNAANRYSDLDDAAAKALPDKCGVQLDIPVSRTTNCDAISQTLTCGQVDAALSTCVTYLTKGGKPSEQCCAGVEGIRQMAANTADKRIACNCVKNAANRYPNLDDVAAKALPEKCGVQLDIPVSRTTNCDAISQALTCGQVDAALSTCVSYLTKGGKPSEQCCAGVEGIRQMATNIADKRIACNCVKNAANSYPNLDDVAAKALPDKCGVQLDIPVSRTTNCDAI